MSDLIIGTWRSASALPAAHTVLPDGCRDVIYRHKKGQRPEWILSPLFDTASVVRSVEAEAMVGFRIKCGTKIDEQTLLRALNAAHPHKDTVAQALEDAAFVCERADEALDLLENYRLSVNAVAKELGVSVRTLQRHVVAATDRTPAYWQSLSRARRSARQICSQLSLCEVASQFGFYDQSHMNREFRRWFKVTPAEFKTCSNLRASVSMSGYGEDRTGVHISTRKPLISVT